MSAHTLGEADGAALRALVVRRPEINLFLLGNLETVGFHQPFCTFWGDFAEDGALRGVANRYFTGWSVFGRPDADWSALAALLDADPAAARLQDNPGGVDSLLPFVHHYAASRIDVEELMRLDAVSFQPQPTPAGWRIRRADDRDLDSLAALYAAAGDMQRPRAAVERPLRDGRVYIAVDRHETIAAAALTNAETRDAPALAMIGGVYTSPEYRALGLSKAVCSALCASLLDDGKIPLLYWQTPAAGHVYRALGFRAIGQWRSAWLQRKPALMDRT